MENVKQLADPDRIERAMTQAADAIVAVITTYGFRAVGALLILTAGWVVAGWVRRLLIRAGYRAGRLDMTIVRFLSSLVKYFIIAFTIIAVLGNFGIQTASVVAVLGAAGLAVGLALQGTLSHLAAGFMLVLFRPFRVGDAIETAGVSGTVREISLFSTEITSADNVRIIIPNNAVWSGVTKNFTATGTRRTDLEVPVPYGADINAVLETITRIVADDPRVAKDPAPVVGVSKFADANIKVAVHFWTATRDTQPAQYALNTAIKANLSAAGLIAK